MVATVRVTAAQLADKWGRRLSGATQDIQNGVNRVTSNPAEAALAAKDKMVARFQAAIAAGKLERGLARVTLAGWKDKMLTLGVGRIPAGVQAAQGKVQDFATQLIAHENAGLQKISGMPSTTLEDNINRMSTFIRHMAGFVRS
jgi:hypothetical protein